MRINTFHLLVCLIPLCFACSDDTKATDTQPPSSETSCETNTTLCNTHEDGSQFVKTCQDGRWVETPCPEDKPICDEKRQECVSKPGETDTCDPQNCSAPEHADAKCIQNACDFECHEGYRKEGNACVSNQADSPYCGDGECNNGETCESCEDDCGKCETEPKCGDGECNNGETCESCEADCGKCETEPKCGDGKCDSSETYASCKTDCAELHPCANGCPNKVAFLYVGKYCKDSCNENYKAYSAEDINNFGITHFVLSTYGGYGAYSSGNNSHHYPELVKTMKDTLTTITSSTNGEKKRVWISTPAFVNYEVVQKADSSQAQKDIYTNHAAYFKQYIQDLREELGADVWNTYVEGIYINNEQVFGSDVIQAVDINSPYSHPHVKMLKDIADEIHRTVNSNGKTWNAKEFAWAPYYPTEYNREEKIKTIGIVVNKADIFDDVFLQPLHYFHTEGNYAANIDAIKQGTYKKAVTWLRDGNNECTIVGGTKTSKTRVGVQMEIDANYFSDDEHKKRYEEYVSYFTNKSGVITGYDKNNYKFSFYLGSRAYKFEDLQKKVREFHGVEPF